MIHYLCIHSTFRYIIHVGAYPSGQIMCQVTAFFDFTMAFEYPLLLFIFALILYTRKFPKIEDTLDNLPMDEMISHRMSPPCSFQQPPQPRFAARTGTPSRQAESRNGGSRTPSVIGSVDGYRRPTSQQASVGQKGFRPQRPVMSPPKRPGSVTGSIEGRLATSTPSGRRQFMASSPLHEVPDEEVDLWDAASLDYPGRQSPKVMGDWEDTYENEDAIFYDDPR